jgi:hypothetical protein
MSEDKGYVYFIRCEGTGLVKVGYSTKPQERLSDLQVGSATKLTLLLTIPGPPGLEKTLHFQLEPYKTRGEWYDLALAAKHARSEFPTEYRIGPRKVTIERISEIPGRRDEGRIYGDYDWGKNRIRIATKDLPLGSQFVALAHELCHEFEHAGYFLGDSDEEIERACDHIGLILGDILATLRWD